MQNILKNCTTDTFTPPRSSPPHCTVLTHPTARDTFFLPVPLEGTPSMGSGLAGLPRAHHPGQRTGEEPLAVGRLSREAAGFTSISEWVGVLQSPSCCRPRPRWVRSRQRHMDQVRGTQLILLFHQPSSMVLLGLLRGIEN